MKKELENEKSASTSVSSIEQEFKELEFDMPKNYAASGVFFK